MREARILKESLFVFQSNVQMLLPILEQTLTNLPDTGSYDIVKQGVVVLMGNLAKHLDKDDPRVKPIVAKLVSSLSTPSQQVCHHVLMILIHASGCVHLQALLQLYTSF